MLKEVSFQITYEGWGGRKGWKGEGDAYGIIRHLEDVYCHSAMQMGAFTSLYHFRA